MTTIQACGLRLSLTTAEADALALVLGEAITELRDERYNTEHFVWFLELKHREMLLGRLLLRLPTPARRAKIPSVSVECP